MAADPALYPLEKYLSASELALRSDSGESTQTALCALTHEADSGLRYWGAYGLLLRGGRGSHAQESLDALLPLLSDGCPEVRSIAAWALLQTPTAATKAREALRSVLREDAAAALFALNIIDWAKENPAAYADLREPILEKQDDVYSGYLKRMTTLLSTVAFQ